MKIQIIRACIKVMILSLFTGLGLYANASDCPPGFVSVPGDAGLQTTDFCVMQFEAKAWKDKNSNKKVDSYEINSNGCDGEGSYCDGGNRNWGLTEHVPASVPQGKPWRRISRDNAINECQELNKVYAGQSGMEFDLITNKEWQTVARNIEKQKDNWSKGKVDTGCLNQGNNGVQSDCSYNGDNPESGDEERARHTLSNGESIYHFSGNVWEWVKDDNNSKKGSNQYMSGYSGSDYGPEGKYTCNESNRDCGYGYGYLDYFTGAVIRGGRWSVDGGGGVFAALLFGNPSLSYYAVGFRCVFRSIGFNPGNGYE